MEEDSVFTKRFLDCVKKPHPERTEQVSGLSLLYMPIARVGTSSSNHEMCQCGAGEL